MNEQHLVFLGYLENEAKGDFDKAMELAGYAKGYKSQLRKTLKEELAQLALERMAAAAVKATINMEDLMDNPNRPGAPTVLKAASEILNRAGIQPTEQSALKIPSTGLFILPAKGSKQSQEELEDE